MASFRPDILKNRTPVAAYDTLVPNGMNLTTGGEAGKRLSEQGRFSTTWKFYGSHFEARIALEHEGVQISQSCMSRAVSRGLCVKCYYFRPQKINNYLVQGCDHAVESRAL